MWRRDVSAADVIPIFVALKNPFAETAFAAAVFVTRLVTAPPPHRSLALSRTFMPVWRRGRGEGVAGRMDFLERSRRNARNESNQDGDDGNVGTFTSLTQPLPLPSVTHVTRVGCERRQKNLINAHHIVLITRARPMIQYLGWHYFTHPMID